MSARERLALDAVALVAVVMAANPALTGIALHEWIGFALTVPLLIHAVVNWEWVVHTVTRLFGKLRATSRVNLVVDIGLFASIVGVTLSGILVVPGLAASLGLQASGAWHLVHLTTSNLTIAFTLLHLALHARWIGSVVGRMVAAPSAAHARSPMTPESW